MVCDVGTVVKVLESLPLVHTHDAQDSRSHRWPSVLNACINLIASDTVRWLAFNR